MATPAPPAVPRASQLGLALNPNPGTNPPVPSQDPSASTSTATAQRASQMAPPERASQIVPPERASQMLSPQRGSQVAPPQRPSQMQPPQRASQMAALEVPQAPSSQRESQSNAAPKKSLQPSPTSSRRGSQVVPALPLPKKGSQSNPSPQGSPTRRPSSQSQRSPTRRGSQIANPSQGEKPPGQEAEMSRKPSQMPTAQTMDARRSSQVPAQAQEATPAQRPSISQNARRVSQVPAQAPEDTLAQRPSISQNARRASQAQPALPSIKENAAAETLPDSPTLASSPSPGAESPPLDTSLSPQTPPDELSATDPTTQPAESTSAQPDQPKEPERPVPYREKPEGKIMRRISLEMRHRLFLMGMRVTYNEMGPTGCIFYVMGEIGKTFVVKLKEFPCCQCGDFLLQRLCKHMMFISLRVFRLEQTDHRIWQNALLPSELKSLLAHPLITPPVKPPFRSKLRRPVVSQQLQQPPPELANQQQQPVPTPPKEIPICCPVCFDEIQFFDNEVKKPLGAKKGPKPKLDMGTWRKKEDYSKVEEVLAEPWALRTKKWESLLHCPAQNCQVNGCMKIIHEVCYLKWCRFKVMNYELPHICTINNFYPCAFKAH